MSTRVTQAQNYEEERNSIAYEYISFFEKLGFLIILIPNNSENIKQYFTLKPELVVLSGGNNIDPSLYKSTEYLDDIHPKRDEAEKVLLEEAIRLGIKTLGICRGFQFLNVYFGGTLIHNIQYHVNTNHMLSSQYNYLNAQASNSYHNQAVVKNNLAENLSVLAVADDNVIEAFIHYDKNILGIQWHPERQEKKYDRELIEAFLKGKI